MVAVATLVVRGVHGRPMSRHVAVLTRADVGLAVVSLLALGFHCAAMFFPAAADNLPQADGIAEAVRDLGRTSQIAYWVPAALLLLALRRAWPPALAAEACALLAIGVTMFWSFGLNAHLVAIAGSVTMTLAVLTTAAGAGSIMGSSPTP
jgi:hypothetical protein